MIPKMKQISDQKVLIRKGKKKIISIVDIVDGIVFKNQIAVSDSIIRKLHLDSTNYVEVSVVKKPLSIGIIKKKLEGHRLSKKEIYEIIENIANNSLTEVEIDDNMTSLRWSPTCKQFGFIFSTNVFFHTY